MREPTKASTETATNSEHPTEGRSTTSAAAEAVAETGEEMTNWQEAHGFLHDCERCARYHAARRAFFDAWHRWMMVAVLISGSAAIATLTETIGLSSAWTVGLMFVPVVVGALNMVWNLTHRARDHEMLARRFYDLAGRINANRADESAVEEWRADLIGINRDEPAAYHALNAECGNAASQALGHGRDTMQRVRWWQQALRHWWRFSPKDFPRNADRATQS